MTHASVNDSPLQVRDDLVRLSVGIEDIGDLLADLRQALDADPHWPGKPDWLWPTGSSSTSST